jgi:hypothetical protein
MFISRNLRNHAHWDARSAMSSRYRFVADITAKCGDEAAWWKKVGIDPTVTARALWLEMHPLPAASDKPIQLTKTTT